ncbi:HNH endonuclease [Sphingobium sp. BHU LFT2]|uniref:HNH endonuclease n=1 Tax=Sphingobium sp. BHU LFT2 TaxID=2807634 RepID=UPI001BEBC03C|nr:HNH endonuclease [Sphingobium sp. BHU LFT2]MBT2246974.1 HNH endonuclease [Sphingobium sp. BHU LFT2]
MIALTKADEPQILTHNESAWTAVVVSKIAAGVEPTDTEKSRYRHADIKAALIVETSGKCAYCESKLLHVAFGDVEHIHPKSKAVANLFKWGNLTLACDRCNTYKGDAEGVIDPYAGDPEPRFTILGPMIMPDPSDVDALYTERKLRLNRPDLLERRAEKIKYLMDQVLILQNAKTAALRDVLADDLRNNETSADQEFAATARTFVATVLPTVLAKLAAP